MTVRGTSLAAAAVALAFLSGVIVGHYRLPPFGPLSQLKGRLPAGSRLGPWLAAQRGDESPADVVMLGDSLTAEGNWAGAFPGISLVNQGKPGETSGVILARLDAAVKHRPRVVVVMAGVNDLRLRMPLAMPELNVTFIAASLKGAGITPIVQSVLFVSGWGDDLNASIAALNARLEGWCEAQGVTYLDLNAVLASGGALDAAVSRDGLHLNEEGYRRWSLLLRPYIERASIRTAAR